MSRVSDDYDDYGSSFNNEAAFWDHRAKMALTGKRGRKALADLREALLALPEKRLVEGALCTVRAPERAGNDWQRADAEEKVSSEGEGVCAVGAYIWHKRVKAGMSPDEAFDSLPLLLDTDSDITETADAGQSAGLTWTLAYLLASRNDETYGPYTPEQRYERFMAWIDERLQVAGSA